MIYARTIGFRGYKAWTQCEFVLAICMIKINPGYHLHIPVYLPFLHNVSFQMWLIYDGTVYGGIGELSNRVVCTVSDDVIGLRE